MHAPKSHARGSDRCTPAVLAQATALLFAVALGAPVLQAQAVPDAGPIAIVSLDGKNPDKAAKVTGALEVSQGKAIIAVSGTVTSGTETTQVTLPRRGVLRVCASTSVKLAADSSVPAGETPGLMMSMDHGAVEASFATSRNSDILLTPDFRILIAGPGSADVKVRLGQHGDTCVDNAGKGAPYVLVSSVFEGGAYRVQPGQRVMFQHGSLHEVVDQEKEPCGCPPAEPKGNEFPLAQSEGIAPAPHVAPAPPVQSSPSSGTGNSVEPLVYSPQPAPAAEPAPVATPQPKPTPAHKPGFMSRVGHFFRRVFGAE